MGFSKQSQYPNGISFSSLAAAVVFFAAGTKVEINNLVLSALTALTITITNAGNTATYFVIRLPANGTHILPGFETSDGLRMEVTTGVDADGAATVLYFNG